MASGRRDSQLLHNGVEIETGGLLPDWEFLESRQPFSNDGLRRHDQERPLHHPLAISERLGAALERVCTQI
jgi:hypothetical protein